jgi:N-glycosylase/DNA lyase
LHEKNNESWDAASKHFKNHEKIIIITPILFNFYCLENIENMKKVPQLTARKLANKSKAKTTNKSIKIFYYS